MRPSRKTRCQEKVPARGMQFLRWRACGHLAVTQENGKWVCGVHSSKGVDSRAARKAKSDARNKVLWYARKVLRSKEKPSAPFTLPEAARFVQMLEGEPSAPAPDEADKWAQDVLAAGPGNAANFGNEYGKHFYRIRLHEFDTRGLIIQADDPQEAIDYVIDRLVARRSRFIMTPERQAELEQDGYLEDYISGGNEGRYIDSLYTSIEEVDGMGNSIGRGRYGPGAA